MNTPKYVFTKSIKCLIDKSAYKFFLGLKDKYKELGGIYYEKLKIQQYLASKIFN